MQQVFPADANGRVIQFFKLEDAQVVGSRYYPGIKLFSYADCQFYHPVNERIMSMPEQITDIVDGPLTYTSRVEERPVFFFVYNVDNYYHFLYDTLPYLITFQHIKKSVPDLKLLINFANPQQNSLNKFVLEFLELLDIHPSDLVIVDSATTYRQLYVSSSYTHDGLSNVAPRAEIYDLYRQLADKVQDDTSLPRKIYISRRSYKHGRYDNIGTNYTTKRTLVNEDELVTLVESHGYVEIFTELLSTREKIALFKNCTHVIGPIGGGICNVLFSKPDTRLMAIVSPLFLDINGRFCYSFANVQASYFKNTQHVEGYQYKQYMRVLIKALNLVGEIQTVNILTKTLGVLYSNEKVAGWNAQTKYEMMWLSEDQVEIIDDGLNSAWTMNLTSFQEVIANG